MGSTVYYRSTQPVALGIAEAVYQEALSTCRGRTRLDCEPVNFFPIQDDGHLLGGSKPNFLPHPDDAAAAAREGQLNGTTRDMLDFLCQLSRDHGIDWELRHDEVPSICFIRGEYCDDTVVAQIEALAELGDILREFDLEEGF
jgi:hypothetical protein